MSVNLSDLGTERRNPRSKHIDRVSTLEMVRIINEEDKQVALAVEVELPAIARAVDALAVALRAGGRVVYCGCGTSGRLGILDASECHPTFGVPQDLFIGLIAGGPKAIHTPIEGAEDNFEQCRADLDALHFTAKDVFVGLAASGRTPYVIGGMRYAQSLGAVTISVTCNKRCPMTEIADIAIAPEPGPEVITGSTRMKSGTAQKMVLNMLSTGAMIQIGKVYGNLMVDLRPSNAKLVARALNIIMEVTGCGDEEARSLLRRADNRVKIALAMAKTGTDAPEAEALLNMHEGRLAELPDRVL